MHTYEKMLIDASNNGFEIVEKNFKSDAKGLCKGRKIGIRKDMSDTEKVCVLAEELGHYYTSVGNILDQNNVNNKKQELVARRWATNILLCPADLIDACRAGNEYISDIAEFLGVTSEFLIDAINVFSAKYGPVYSDGEYEIRFCERGFNINKSAQA
jgi:Zn-dependent peptidase ImmA (M78 family)